MSVLKNFSFHKFTGFIFNLFLVLPGAYFLSVGFQWIVVPENAASTLMMPLLSGVGLSAQIGDIGGLFLAMGLLVMIAVTTKKGDCLLSVAVLLTCIGLYRMLAFTLHGATLIVQMLVFEIILSVWFYIASRKLAVKGVENDK